MNLTTDFQNFHLPTEQADRSRVISRLPPSPVALPRAGAAGALIPFNAGRHGVDAAAGRAVAAGARGSAQQGAGYEAVSCSCCAAAHSYRPVSVRYKANKLCA